MARSKGVTISVKVPIKWERMTKRTRQRLRQIVGRDTRVIHAFLGIIEQYESELLTGRNKDRIDDGALDQLTMTAIQVREGYEQRLTVPHDFKVRFPRIAPSEMVECRQTAVALYESYLKLRKKRRRKASRPRETNSRKRIPRWVFSARFRLFESRTSVGRWWLELRDSMDSMLEGRRFHDKILIPLKVSPFHLKQFNRGDVKALQIFVDRSSKWWASFAVRVKLPPSSCEGLKPAVLGIDLGIEKAVCTTVVTPEKVRETRYFLQKDKARNLETLDTLVSALQRERDRRKDDGQDSDGVLKRLVKLRRKRENVAREYDRVLVRELIEYILVLSEKYRLYISLGRLKNIRFTARRGNYKGRTFRGMIHSWAFSRISQSLKHQLSQIGWPVEGKASRFQTVSESWTSILCWKCGTKGKRPRQNYFVCPSCKHQTNADRNGAINIAGRLIMLTDSLHSVKGVGKWASSVDAGRRARLKTRRKKPSLGNSSLPSKDITSRLGESAAVHQVQMDLLSFGDEVELGDNDPAVARTLENLSVAAKDVRGPKQEKDVRSVGGIPSQ